MKSSTPATALLVLALAFLGASVPALAAYRIERLEPGSWWVGMKNGSLQLLVHGPRIADLDPIISYPGVTVDRVERTENVSYLFITLTVADSARPGTVRIDFNLDGKRELSRDLLLQAREPGSATRPSFTPADVIYLITPDRFVNGNPRNDSVRGYRDGYNRSDPHGRHGGDLEGIRARLDYIAGMGFTQIWLNPVLENNQPEASYHGYATTDFYRVDPRFGDNEQYRALAREARAKGIGLIKDVILNHVGSEHWWMKSPPSRDWFNHNGRFVPTTHNHEVLHDPYAPRSERLRMADGWFVATMPDLNQRNPLLATYLVQNTIWWIEYAGLSGLRVDTWPYPDRDFLAHWTQRALAEYPTLNIVGEEWTSNSALAARWQRGQTWGDGYVTHLPGVFDFPLQEAVVHGLTEEPGRAPGLARIYRSLANDFLYPDPWNLVIFPDNHDMSRIFTQLDEQLDLHKIATGFYATIRGVPSFYYGTEILMSNRGTDSHGIIRSDFPGGWRDDSADAFSGKGLTQQQLETQEFTRQVLNWRKGASAIHGGKLTQYAPEDGVYVYFRHDDRQKIMVVINMGNGRTLEVARFREAIGSSTHATDVLTGRQLALSAGIDVPTRSITILELGSQTRAAAPATSATPATSAASRRRR